MKANVIIRKQSIKARTSNESVAFDLKKYLNDSLQIELVTMLQKVFEQFEDDGSFVTIDKLKVNIGTLSQSEFEKSFFQIAAPYLVRELVKQLKFKENTKDTFYGSNRNHAATNSSGLKMKDQEGPHKNLQIEALFYFLLEGVFPWWHKDPLQTPAMLLQSFSNNEQEALLSKIVALKFTGKSGEVQKLASRLFFHLPGNNFQQVIYGLLKLLSNAYLNKQCEVLLLNINLLTRLLALKKVELFIQLFSFLIVKGERDFTRQFLLSLIKAHSLPKDFEVRLDNVKKTFTDDDFKVVINILTDLVKHVGTSTAHEEQKDPSNTQPKDNNVLPDDALYISNSGLVLLHPFLQSFFFELGLLNPQNQFLSKASAFKAAVLLYYLQCGERYYKEWEMGLNKIICNIPVSEVLPDGIELSENEIAECETLLQIVIKYWEALKGCSTQALQQTFLVREGKISYIQNTWLLQVERTGTDILLDRLPWGYNTIKFPWNPNIFYIEW